MMRSIKKVYLFLSALAVLIFLAAGCIRPPRLSQFQESSAIPTPQLIKRAYLTFDVDMTPLMRYRLAHHRVSAWYDQRIINYLEDNKIPATFFVTGMFAEIYPDVVKNLAAVPYFSVQNHGYDHSAFESNCYRLTVLVSDQQKIDQITKTQTILTALTGQPSSLFRYPGLCHNAHDDDLVRSLGLEVNNGDLVSADAFNDNAKTIRNKVINNIKDGSIIVMHLGGPNAPATFNALQIIAPDLNKQGFSFEKLSGR